MSDATLMPFARSRGAKLAVQGESERSRRLKPAAQDGTIDSRQMGAFMLSIVCLNSVVGCGYSTQRPFRTDIQTVHVEMFHSREFRRELEFRLTESIVKRIETDTPYRIVPRRRADALLTGELLKIENRIFGDDFDTDLPREIGSTMAVRFRFQDLRSGEILVDRPRFVYQSSHIPSVGETFTQGMTRAMDGMAEQIVETLETGW